MLKNLVIAGIAACIPALAVTTTYNFDFTQDSGSYSTFSEYSGTLGVTLKAFSTSSSTSSFSNATIGAYSGSGIGICNSSTESGSSCTSPEHQIDNNGRYEFVLFRFSTPVDLGSISIKNFGGASNSVDRDLVYYTSTNTASSLNFGSATLNSLGNGFGIATTVNCSGGCSGSTSNVTLNADGVTYLLLGAAGPGGDSSKDYFKLTGLTVSIDSAPDVATPEPSTISLSLIALGGAAWASRKRRESAKS